MVSLENFNKHLNNNFTQLLPGNRGWKNTSKLIYEDSITIISKF